MICQCKVNNLPLLHLLCTHSRVIWACIPALGNNKPFYYCLSLFFNLSFFLLKLSERNPKNSVQDVEKENKTPNFPFKHPSPNPTDFATSFKDSKLIVTYTTFWSSQRAWCFSCKNGGTESKIVVFIYDISNHPIHYKPKPSWTGNKPQPKPSFFEWSYLSIEQTL